MLFTKNFLFNLKNKTMGITGQEELALKVIDNFKRTVAIHKDDFKGDSERRSRFNKKALVLEILSFAREMCMEQIKSCSEELFSEDFDHETTLCIAQCKNILEL
jgi:hypothetical protein